MESHAYACVEDPAFLSLWKEANLRPISWEEFKTWEMPKHTDAAETWHAIMTLRQCLGTTLGFDERRLIELWINLPEHARHLVQDIAVRTAPSSPAGIYATTHTYPEINLGAQIEELLASLRADGTELDYESVRALWLGEREPHDDNETLVCNYRSLILEELRILDGSSRASAAMNLRGLYQALIKNARDAFSDAPLDSPSDTNSIRWDRTVLANLSNCFANAGNLDATEVLTASYYIWGGTMTVHLVNRHQTLFGSLLRRVFFLRCNNVPLSLLPLNTRSFRGTMPDKSADSFDVTGNVVPYLEDAADMLERLESFIKQEERQSRNLSDAVGKSTTFNYRQKDMLRQLIAHPDAELSYESLMKKYQSSYNTIRADLNSLVNRGLLYTTNDGRLLSFHPVPNFVRVLGRILGA